MKIIYIILLALFSVLKITAQNEVQYKLDSVIVTSNRVPAQFSEIGRTVEVIELKEIKLLPATNLQDLLDYTPGLDIKQRGPEGIQADISIRGGSFEQTLIMIDGIKLSDPQTGHHNMNLPISYSQVERIEILKGQGSRIYGANAFGGVINIISKRSASNNLQMDISGGESSYYSLGLNSSLKYGISSHHISFGKIKSDGYKPNTESERYNFSLSNSLNFHSAVIKTLFGYVDKDFGANSYYTIRFPDQAEKTKTYLAAISGEVEIYRFSLSPKLYWRRNDDEFVLNKFDPGFYKNNHKTNVYGSEIQASTNILGGTTTFGLEYIQDQIVSNNLGEHSRETKGLFIEQMTNLSSKISISLGGFAYSYSELDWKLWPGIDLTYKALENLKIYANFGNAFRIPTYTELYYSDPVTSGNADLKPEESINYELGFNYNIKELKISTAYFRRESTNLIDYVLDQSDNLWKAQNFTKINTYGIEVGLQFNLNKLTNNIFQQISLDYTYLNSDKADLDLNSRYVLEHLKHDLSIKMFHSLPFGIRQSWTLNYEDRITLGDHFTIDTKLNKTFSNFSVFVKASNLFNKSFEEIPGVPLPGRWIIGGVKLNIL